MKNRIRYSVVATTALFALATVTPVLVSAQSARGQEMQSQVQEKKEPNQNQKDNNTERKEQPKTKSTEAQLKACQNREDAVTSIMAKLAERGTRQIDVFTKISERTQAFYVEKGNTLAEYDTLVADVNTKKIAAQAQVDEVRAASVAFNCESADPKASLASFKELRTTEKAALKNYKTAVKNLIVGVKSVQPTEPAPTPSTSTEGVRP